MIRASFVILAACLAGCQGGAKSSNQANATAAAGQNQAAPAPAPATNQANASAAAPTNQAEPAQAAGTPVPASYDWNFVTHGGIGEVDFGDGDWAEGVSLLHVWCLPGSGGVNMDVRAQEEGSLTLRVGAASLTRPASSETPTPLTHPVLRALREGGAATINDGRTEHTLTAKADGRRQLTEFFDYCSKE
jgi:hypothetical protein